MPALLCHICLIRMLQLQVVENKTMKRYIGSSIWTFQSCSRSGRCLPSSQVLLVQPSLMCLLHPEAAMVWKGNTAARLPPKASQPHIRPSRRNERVASFHHWGKFLFHSNWTILGHVSIPGPITVARGRDSTNWLRPFKVISWPSSWPDYSRIRKEEEGWGHIVL